MGAAWVQSAVGSISKIVGVHPEEGTSPQISCLDWIPQKQTLNQEFEY